ncbi:hypothetical protein P691DRAFT_788090 [Macrolepiota fuliginosa MF-IS2]|uniref:Uncharacterized protein n=1 Tax=Macrolepiota fuliginosa MF-IS2 TaxID=1400762 RepID=A0A9P5XHD5_9AGAR|nr:hypothetical protein P691DRAFT_788090 [Macrolepiota fuliginosa MF-IS2]
MSRHTLVIAFDVLCFLAVLSILCTLLPAMLSRNVKRSVGWYSLMVAWLLFSVGYVLLVGRQERPEEPPRGLCLAQVLLTYPAPALMFAGPLPPTQTHSDANPGCGVVLFQNIKLKVWQSWANQNHSDILGGNLSQMEPAPNGLYCHINGLTQNLLVTTIIVLHPPVIGEKGLVLNFIYSVWTGFSMYRHWASFRRLSQTDRHIFLTVYIRFLFVTISAFIALVFSIRSYSALTDPDTGNFSIAYPFIAICIALAFGTQKDMLQAWVFWKYSEPCNTIVFHGHTSATTGGIFPSRNPLSIGTLLPHPQEEKQESQCPTIVYSQSSATTSIHKPRLEEGMLKGHIESSGQ